MGSKKILIIGNCQVVGVSKIISAITGAECKQYHVSKKILSDNPDGFVSFTDYDYVFINKFDSSWEYLAFDNVKDRKGIIFLPKIVFRGSHPDSIYIKNGDGVLSSSFGDYHSMIISC